MDTPTTNNDFVLDPPLATPNIDGNDDIVGYKNIDTDNDNNIIMENEDYPENYNIHEEDDDDFQLDTQLDTTNVQLHPDPLHDLPVEANNIWCSTHVCTKPQQLIPSIDRFKYYDSTVATTILEQDCVDIVGPEYHLEPNYTLVAHDVMTQLYMKAGQEKFKECGKKSVTTELSQLHSHDTFNHVDSKTLNR